MIFQGRYWVTKLHSLKVENSVLFSRLIEGLNLKDSFSDSSEGLFQRSKGGAQIYSFCDKLGSQNIKRLLKKKQTSQDNKFSTFLCLGRYKSLGFLAV